MAITVTPTGAALGAEIGGLDLRRIDDGDFAAIHNAWLDHQVVLFRGQVLNDDDMIAFSRRFGELDFAPIQENGRRFVDGHPEIYVVSNVIENGVAIGSLGAGEAVWHTDMSYLEDPPKASMLYAIEVPQAGGDTWLRDMYRPSRRCPPRCATHRRAAGQARRHLQQRRLRPAGVTPTDDPREAPGTYHPMSAPIPKAGGACCISGGGGWRISRGWRCRSRRRCWTKSGGMRRAVISFAHHWRVGDVVLWDNRCTMHRRDPFDASSRRIMHRTQMKGAAQPVA